MKKRKWKYLRKQYMTKKGYFKIRFESFTIPSYEFKGFMQSPEPFGNFAMMIPTEPYKEYIYKEPYRTRSERRFNLPLKYYSTIKTTK